MTKRKNDLINQQINNIDRFIKLTVYIRLLSDFPA